MERLIHQDYLTRLEMNFDEACNLFDAFHYYPKCASLETAEFMMLFYENLFKSFDVRAAFSNAQSVMRQKYDPYYWGAFVLIE